MEKDTIFAAVGRTLCELLTKDGFVEFTKSLATFCPWLGKPSPSKPDYTLDDPHAHYPHPSHVYELESLVRVLADRLGRCAFTTWAMTPEGNESVRSVLSYEYFTAVVPRLSRDITLEYRGEVSIVNVGDRSFEAYPSQEIRTTSPIESFYPHITAEGCLTKVRSGYDARKTIELIHKYGGLAVIEHNATKTCKLLQYTITRPQEDAFIKELFAMADATEVFNSYNILWMATSNAKAKRVAEQYTIPKIAGGDLHFGTSSKLARALHRRMIGRAGVWLPRHDVQGLTGREILELKRNDLRTGNFERLEAYVDPLTFFVTMVPPIIYRTLDSLLKRIGIHLSLHTDSIS